MLWEVNSVTKSDVRRNSVHIDTNLIPDQERDNLARCTLALLHNILSQPGGREALDRQKSRICAARPTG